MLLETLRCELCDVYRRLERHGTSSAPGSISGIDRERSLIAITPPAIPGAELEPSRIPVLDLNGQAVEGALSSPDAPTHLVLYNTFRHVGGIAHAHSPFAAMFAQAGRPIPCLGTLHAYRFHGEIPITRALRKPEVEGNYQHNTGLVILERFLRLNPREVPAVLVMHQGLFTWGSCVIEAVDTCIAVEEIARLAFGTLQLNPSPPAIPQMLQDRLFMDSQGAARP